MSEEFLSVKSVETAHFLRLTAQNLIQWAFWRSKANRGWKMAFKVRVILSLALCSAAAGPGSILWPQIACHWGPNTLIDALFPRALSSKTISKYAIFGLPNATVSILLRSRRHITEHITDANPLLITGVDNLAWPKLCVVESHNTKFRAVSLNHRLWSG